MPNAITTAIAGLALALLCLILGECHGEHRGSGNTRNELQAEYAGKLAEGYREAAIKQQAETTRANALAASLITTKHDIETARASLRGRIVYVTREIPADCGLPPDAVQLWNEARRLSAPGVPPAGGSGGTDGQAAAAASFDSGVQHNASIADALANHVDYVSFCEGVVAQRDQLQELVRGWAK